MQENFLNVLAEEVATMKVHPTIVFKMSNIVQRVLNAFEIDYDFNYKVDSIFVDESEYAMK
jgi:hypothetical protein